MEHKFKKGDTNYQLSAIPMGGYCKMAGEEPNDDLTGAPDEFYSKSPLRRLSIIFAGPFVNYLFGIFLFIIIMAIGIERPTYTNRVSVMKNITINKKQILSPAVSAGMKEGDSIIKIDGEEITDWTMIRKTLVISGDKDKRAVTIKRGNTVQELKIKPVLDPDTGASVIGVLPHAGNRIADVTKDEPAQKAGLRVNDAIIRINKKKIDNFYDLQEIISKNPDKRISLQALRNGRIMNYNLKVKNIEGKGFIGVSFEQKGTTHIARSKNILHAVSDGFNRANGVVSEVIYGLKLMVSGKIRVLKAVKSPVAIIYYAGKTSEAGLLSFIWFMGYISIALAFFNLLPIPAVDGSYILFFLFELISGKKLNFKVIRVIQYVGLMVLMTLLAFLMLNDFLGFFKGTHTVKGLKGIMA
ncbi:MAG: RIP metalloprotease RseP [Spirochaetes bacterium]|nr:RIP metalloprotease RseP [Spirochaetota bacterium]